MRLRRTCLLSLLVLVGFAAPAHAADEPPTVTKIAPAAGPATGGTEITIVGTGLTGATAVRFGGERATTFEVVSDSEIDATAPAGSGAAHVTVETPAGASGESASDRFAYTPVVSGLDPPSGSVSGGTEVTIVGAGFENVTGVSFGGEPAESYTVVSRTLITAVPAAAARGTAGVRVTTATGTSAASAGARFSFRVAVSGVSPSTAPAGSRVKVEGIGFATARSVRFGDASTGFVVLSDTRLLVVVPAGEGTVDVVVETEHGSTSTGSDSRFAYGGGVTATVGGVVTPATPKPTSPPAGKPSDPKTTKPGAGSARLRVRLPRLIVERPPTSRVTWVAVRVGTPVPTGLRIEVRDAKGRRLPFLFHDEGTALVHAVRAGAGLRWLVLRIPNAEIADGARYRVQVTATDDQGHRARRVRTFTA